MSDFPTDFVDASQPLSPAMLGKEGQAAVQNLTEKGYEVRLGLAADDVAKIKQIALEALMREYVPRDATERFANVETAKKWLGKGRAFFSLVKKSNQELVGYGWAGPGTSEFVPGGQHTWAIRIGQAGQGQGLATPFSQLIVEVSEALHGAGNIWLETWASNGAAVHVYHKLGFKDAATEPAERLDGNGQTVADARIYMSK